MASFSVRNNQETFSPCLCPTKRRMEHKQILERSFKINNILTCLCCGVIMDQYINILYVYRLPNEAVKIPGNFLRYILCN